MSAQERTQRPDSSAVLRYSYRALILIVIAFAFAKGPATGFAQTNTQSNQKLNFVGTSVLHATVPGTGASQQPEVDTLDTGDGSVKAGASNGTPRHTNLMIPAKETARRRQNAETSAASSTFPPPEPVVQGDKVVDFQAAGFEGFSGLNHVDQRTANGRNQFSVEPPDQGLCAGNGYVVETVNSVIRVFDTAGNPLTGVEDMNTFFGLAAAIDRTQTPPLFGPVISDPRCYFDLQTRRWFVSELMEDIGGNAGPRAAIST